jgi:hypothetical protein
MDGAPRLTGQWDVTLSRAFLERKALPIRRRNEIHFAMSLFLVFAAAPFANAQAAAAPTAAELNAITERGILLNEYDQAAWHASDAAQTANPKTIEGQRYIAKKENGKWIVAFGKLNADKNLFQIYYEAAQKAKPQEFSVSAEKADRADRGFYLFAARAMEIALKDFHGEKRPYNVAVLPASQEQLLVYVYPAQTKPRIYPLGGDVRYLISEDGTKIIEKRQMHKTILESGAPKDKGKKLVAGFHTHVLSDVPEDTDVFHVLTQDPPLPEIIGTPHFLYKILVDGTITIEKQKK